MVRKMAIGSLVPDSISSVERTRSRRCTIAGAQQEENRRRVGGGDGGAEQERFQPGEIGQVESGRAEQAGGQHDADRGERDGGQGGLAQRRDRRAETGIEQDDGKRQRADEIGEPRIVELDAETVGAGGQAEAEEQKQQRSAEAEGDQARKRGGEHKRRAHQRHEINRLIHAVVAPPSAPFVPYLTVRRRQGGAKKQRRFLPLRHLVAALGRQTKNARAEPGRFQETDRAMPDQEMVLPKAAVDVGHAVREAPFIVVPGQHRRRSCRP